MFLRLSVLYPTDNQEAIFNPWCSSYTLMEWIRKKCNCDSDSKYQNLEPGNTATCYHGNILL